MIIFQSLRDVMIDSVLDLNLSREERVALLCSMYGVPFHYLPEELKNPFRSAAQKYFGKYKSLEKFYERG